MSYTYEQAVAAGKKAVAAGDTEAANEIAAYISAQSLAPAEPTAAPQDTGGGSSFIDQMFGYPDVEGKSFGSDQMTAEDAAAADERVGRVQDHMDIPGGIAGSMAGAKAGALTGTPVGVAAGAVVGGMAGTFGGSVLTDWMNNENADFDEATKEALISGGMDVATLGLAKAFKPVAKALGLDGELLGKAWNHFQDTGKLPGAGSAASKRQTQELLAREGGTLTAYQTGEATGTQKIAEGLGRVGFLSGRAFEELDAKNTRIVGNKLNELIDETMEEVTGEIGAGVHGVIKAGKNAAQDQYNKGLEAITEEAGSQTFLPQWISGTVKKFMKDNSASYGSTLNDEALGIAQKWQQTFKKLPTMSVEDLLKFQRQLNDEISTLGDFGKTNNTVASQQLADLASRIRKTTSAILEETNPAAYQQYKALNESYGEAMKGVVPKVNARTIAAADTGDFDAIARTLEGKNPDKIEAFMKSIDESYKQMGDMVPDDIKYATATEAKEAVKQGWLKNVFGDAVNEGFDPVTFAKKANFYEKPANKRAAEAVLGKDGFVQFKKLLNAMHDITAKDSGFFGSLVLRSKEVGALSTPDQAVRLGSVFMGPLMLSKMTRNPKTVNKLLAGWKKAQHARKAGKISLANDYINQTFQGIMEEFTPEEQEEIRNSMIGEPEA